MKVTMKELVDSIINTPKLHFPKSERGYDWHDVPEGKFRAELHKFTPEESRKGQQGYRLTWHFRDPSSKKYYYVCNSYIGGGIEVLNKGIRMWLGDDLDKYLDDQDFLNPELLVGLEADILVVRTTFPDTGYSFVRAERFAAPGFYVKDSIVPHAEHGAGPCGIHGLN